MISTRQSRTHHLNQLRSYKEITVCINCFILLSSIPPAASASALADAAEGMVHGYASPYGMAHVPCDIFGSASITFPARSERRRPICTLSRLQSVSGNSAQAPQSVRSLRSWKTHNGWLPRFLLVPSAVLQRPAPRKASRCHQGLSCLPRPTIRWPNGYLRC